jgi:hypothetical protein
LQQFLDVSKSDVAQVRGIVAEAVYAGQVAGPALAWRVNQAVGPGLFEEKFLAQCL